jgi:hypothetical protein
MDDSNHRAIQKLQVIQGLWLDIGRAKLGTPEYNALIKRIRSESAEYQALVDAPTKRDESQSKARNK